MQRRGGTIVAPHESGSALAHRNIWLQRKAWSPSVDLGHGSRGGVTLVSWDQRFFDPIILSGRKPLVTLRDAVEYMMPLGARQWLPHSGQRARWGHAD
jgi:hypothetical protein